MSARALRYLLLTRFKNRVRAFVGGLLRPKNILAVLMGVGLILLLLVDVSPGGTMTIEMRYAVITSLFGFLLLITIVSSLGQEGMAFSAADLDLLFPGPFKRRHLLLYWFVPQYLMSIIMALFWMLMFGGRRLPHPGWFLFACFLYQVVTVHLAAFSAHLGILLAEKFFSRLKPAITVVTTVLLLGLLGVAVLIFSDSGGVPGKLMPIAESPVVQVLFFPATAAADLGIVDGVDRWIALAKLLGAAAIAFGLVMLVNVGFIEASFHASRKVHAKVKDMKRGVLSAKKRHKGGSARAPRGWRGPWAILWRDVLTLRRQLRTLIGGLLMIVILIAIAAGREGQDDLVQLAIIYLAMFPLWLTPPIGFRIDAPYLATYRMLPISAVGRAAGMGLCSVLVPWLLQLLVIVALVIGGLMSPVYGIAALIGFFAIGATFVLVEGLFLATGGGIRRTDFGGNIIRMMVQTLAIMPGILIVAAGYYALRSMAGAIFLAAAAQGAVVWGLLYWVGARLDSCDLRLEAE
ncbi:MAG: putative ABC exporter domain-containing protein [Planctomycetota bacterium]|nr:putative ABC exporter domain-containing protein [Planctomycetota bacterium]